MKRPMRLVGLLLGVSVIALLEATSAIAQPKPRPNIFNEPPYNRSPRPASPPTLIPEKEPTPDAVLTLVDGSITIKLVNKTGAEIVYQVIGNTEQRSLNGRSDVTLQSLKTPRTITFYRRDRGFLLVGLQPSTPGSLEVTFTETTDFATDKTSMVIDAKGQVFLN